MKVNPKYGIDSLLFGMKEADVTALYGKPDKEFRDDDSNVIRIYNDKKSRLTFYQDEDFRLGYIICSHPELSLFGQRIIGRKIQEAKESLQLHGFIKWEQEDFDLAENHFDETNWLILQAEFSEITKVEMGAIINDKDEFDWKFPMKKK